MSKIKNIEKEPKIDKKVVSISLGSSKRDHTAHAVLLGKKFKVERIGTDGDFKKAIKLLRQMDGKVDAFGLGGADFYLGAGEKRYIIRDLLKVKNAVSKTPFVDGGGIKNTLERDVVEVLRNEGIKLKGKKVLMPSAVDRFGIAEAFYNAGCKTLFGDFIFGLGLPIPIRTIKTLKILAKLLLPILTKLPFRILYPIGAEQEKTPSKKYQKYYLDADIIAGDFLYIRKYMPDDLSGKMIITNTLTANDLNELKKRNLDILVTVTPEFSGRYFGTNVVDAIVVSLINKPVEEITDKDYRDMLFKLKFTPKVNYLHESNKL
ncbi:MAG: quinate 5-dehydrogenase [Actinomycetia bacterium]|nr:quinate 5-dehydrogenase [Actinomycetes bacterium]